MEYEAPEARRFRFAAVEISCEISFMARYLRIRAAGGKDGEYMDRITLWGTELRVSPLCLGTAQYGTGLPREAAVAQMRYYVEHGGNFIDTAHVYGDWGADGPALSERIIGRWLRETGNRGRVILSTKGAHPRLETMNVPRLSGRDIMEDLEGSLKALGVEAADLYFLHRDDPSVPVEDILDCLERARSAGKIRYYGCSNWTLARMREAGKAAKANGFAGFVCNQAMWSLADINASGVQDRTLVVMDKAMRQYHVETNLSAMAYTSLANGYFMRRESGAPLAEPMKALYANASNEMIRKLIGDAGKEGFSALDVSLGYLLQQPFSSVAAAAFSKGEQLEEAMRSAEKKLPAELLEALGKAKEFVC